MPIVEYFYLDCIFLRLARLANNFLIPVSLSKATVSLISLFTTVEFIMIPSPNVLCLTLSPVLKLGVVVVSIALFFRELTLTPFLLIGVVSRLFKCLDISVFWPELDVMFLVCLI